MDVSHSSHTLTINDHSIEFSDKIESVLTIEKDVIVLLEFQGEHSPQNVVSINKHGEINWLIEPVDNDEVGENIGDSQQSPYTGIRATDKGLVAHNYNSGRYVVDLESGEVDLLGWRK